MSTLPRLIKRAATGELLPADATDWAGVYIPAAEITVARRILTGRFGFASANNAALVPVLRERIAVLEEALDAIGPLLEGCDCIHSDEDDPELCPCAKRRAALAAATRSGT